MTCGTRVILTLMRLLSLPAVSLLSACGAVGVTHDVRITMDDPTGRLGAPPWSVEIGSASGGQTTFGSASPDSPFRETLREVRGVHGLTARSNEQRFNFRMPAPADG
ncbi:hypothetical protein LuPra_03934 [Luteitalea pratensis]|uniref:Uncharacterized protein n=1 Tax=Luteitalea pratensis TaxID=1855912 RepID=A0A143PQ29_LUTPR|nr:hypothetical protein [Luteitalea pratensis]AMY10695.1 hypothetical protein LuPra_03934 [Luteitalea pratensis]